MIAGCGYAKLTSYRSLVYENFHNTSDQGHGGEMTCPRDEKGVGGEPRWIYNMYTVPIFESGPYKEPPFEIRK